MRINKLLFIPSNLFYYTRIMKYLRNLLKEYQPRVLEQIPDDVQRSRLQHDISLVEAVLKLVHLRRRRFQQTKLERLSP
jgi:hypothetical protein